MDKGRKLRRYSRKDYTQMVDFPVEIVGRDGVVRRYSFEESVRLYQRRIESAGMRYDDGEVVQAEVRHCRLRIEQLRKSYFARYGWDALRTPGSGRLDGEFAGEVAAFLRRCLSETPGAAVGGVELAWLTEGEHHHLYYVRGEGGLLEGGNALLYVHRFGEEDGGRAREAFFDYLKVLQTVKRIGQGVEELVAFHHTSDCGLILTREAGAEGAGPRTPPNRTSDDWVDLDEDGDDPLRDAMLMLRKGRAAAALDLLERAYEEHPYRRSAYVAALVVADQVGAAPRCQTAALMARHYFPDDALFTYHAAIAALRLGETGEAEARAEELRERAPGAPGTHLVTALLAVLDGRSGAGLASLRLALNAAQVDSDVFVAARRLIRLVLVRSILRFTGLGVLVTGLAAVGVGRWWALTLVAAGGLLIPLAGAAHGRHVRRLVSASGAEGLRLATPGALRMRDEPEEADAPDG